MLFVLCMVSLFAAVALPILARAQSIQWTRQFGTTNPDEASGVAVDATGVYVVGYTTGTLPGQTSAGFYDAFVRKYDASGTEQWTRQFGTISSDSASGVAVDATGVYVVGYTSGTLPGQTSAGLSDVFVRKYDARGNELWTRQFGTADSDGASGVAADATGIYVVGGTTGALPAQTSARLGDAFVRKYDASGNVLWTRQFGTPAHDSASAVAVDATSVYVVGYTGAASIQGSDAFVRKYDLNGTEQWTRQFGSGRRNDGALGVAVDASGVYVAGYTGEDIGGVGDAFVSKYDASGNVQWTDGFGTAGPDRARGVAVDATGVYIAGDTDWVLPGQTHTGRTDIFVRKYDANGTEQWTRQFGTTARDAASGVAVDGTGVYVAGYTNSALPGQTGAGNEDAFVVKLAFIPPGQTSDQPVLNPGGIVNDASFRRSSEPNSAVAPGAMVAIFGTNLAAGTYAASEVPLPTTLGDTAVTFNDIPAPLFFVSPTQINAQIPFEVPTGTALVRVRRGNVVSVAQSVAVASFSPGIFTLNRQGTGEGAILHGDDFRPVNEAAPAQPGEVVAIYGTGLGQLVSPVRTGSGPPSPPPETLTRPLVTIGGIPAEVIYSGAASGLVGLYQVNVRVPAGVPAGAAVPLVLSIGGISANTVTIALQGGPLLEARLVAPSIVTVKPPQVLVEVPVLVSLTNRGTTSRTLVLPTPCEVHRWALYDPSGALNHWWPGPEVVCIQVIATLTIAPGETITENATVLLDGRLLRDRTSYRLIYLFWGIPSEATFAVEVVPPIGVQVVQ